MRAAQFAGGAMSYPLVESIIIGSAFVVWAPTIITLGSPHGIAAMKRLTHRGDSGLSGSIPFIILERCMRASQTLAASIHGIPCRLRTAEMRDAIERVFAKIEQEFPKDFSRLRNRIRKITPVTRAEAAEGIIGRWREIPPDTDSQDATIWDQEFGTAPGIISLSEKIDMDTALGLIAHELGHACTREQDLERRGILEDEWQSELAADWYAYKWGFGRSIAKFRKERHHGHHGPPPGTVFEIENQGTPLRYYLTRNFRAIPLECPLTTRRGRCNLCRRTTNSSAQQPFL